MDKQIKALAETRAREISNGLLTLAELGTTDQEGCWLAAEDEYISRIYPEPVKCVCGYDVLKGKHADGCPMGMFYRLAEMRTAYRCMEIVDRIEPGTMFMLDTIILRIRREFGLKESTPESDSTARTTHESAEG